MSSRERAPEPEWVRPAAAAFCDSLARPVRYGDPPRRDVIGWVASLLAVEHTVRWLRLCAALRIRHRFASDPTEMDDAMRAVAAAIVETMVLPLLPAENKRVLTTNVRRHVRRSAGAGLTFMHVFDFFLALFDLEEGLHNSPIAAHLPQQRAPEPGTSVAAPAILPASVQPANAPMGEDGRQPDDVDEICATGQNISSIDITSVVNGSMRDNGDVNMLDAGKCVPGGDDADAPVWAEVFALKYYFNVAVERFRTVCTAVGTRHVRNAIEAATCDYAWARTHAAMCGLDAGQARVIHLVVLKGSSAEGEAALQRSHFTVYQENDPLVFAAALSTLDPDRAILVADRHVGLSITRHNLISQGGTKIRLNATRSATNLRKLMYAEALLARRDSGAISQSAFMHLIHKLTMLNSGLGANTPGSTWADPWPHWPPLDEKDKEVLEIRYSCGNIVAGALLAATVMANHILGVGAITDFEFQAALSTLRSISDMGDAAAPSYVGLALSQPGPNQNVEEAIRYYRLAVERGNKNAPAVLGSLLLERGGDAVECTDLFKLSVARGGRYGHRYLADVLFKGAPGVPQDTEQARRLYEDAARLGDPVASKVVDSAQW